MIHSELLDIICCPETRQPLRLASDGELRRVNEAADAKGGRSRPPISAGLVRRDGKVLYPIRNGIPILLLDARIELPDAAGAPGSEKQSEEQVEQDRDPDHHPVKSDAGS